MIPMEEKNGIDTVKESIGGSMYL